MEKEEILKMAQSKQNEEFENQIIREANQKATGILIILCIMVFLTKVIVSDFRGLEDVIPFFDVMVILFGFMSTTYYLIFKKLHEKKYLYICLLFFFAFIFYMYKFICSI